MVSPGEDPIFGFFQVPPGEAKGRLHAVALWFLCLSYGSGWRAVVVGHAQATSRPIRCRSFGQSASHRSGCVPSALNGKERGFFAPSFRLSRLARLPQPFPFPSCQEHS